MKLTSILVLSPPFSPGSAAEEEHGFLCVKSVRVRPALIATAIEVCPALLAEVHVQPALIAKVKVNPCQG